MPQSERRLSKFFRFTQGEISWVMINTAKAGNRVTIQSCKLKKSMKIPVPAIRKTLPTNWMSACEMN